MEEEILFGIAFFLVFLAGMAVGSAIDIIDTKEYLKNKNMGNVTLVHQPNTPPFKAPKPSTPKPDYPPPVCGKPQVQVIELHVKYDDFQPNKLPKTEEKQQPTKPTAPRVKIVTESFTGKSKEKQPIPSYKVADPCSYCEANSSKCETCRDAGDYRVFYNYDGWPPIDEIGDGNYRKIMF